MKFSKILMALTLSACVASATTLAIVDGKKITEDDLSFFKQIMPNFNYNDLNEGDKKLAVEQAIDRILIIKQAKKEGIEKSDTYKKAIEDASNKFLMDLWVKQLADKISKEKIPDADIKKYYDENKKQFVKQEAKAKHILVKDLATANKIEDILAKTPAKNLEAEFSKLAKEYSIDTASKKDGGELGYFNKSSMDPDFANAAYALKVGEYTKTPVKTKYGYHIILLEDKKAEVVVPFADVKDDIINAIKASQFQTAIQKQVQLLRKDAKIKVFVK